MQALAKKMGIDATGMTNEQIKIAISKSGAEQKEIKGRVKKVQTKEDLIATAAECGIDTTGMNEEQIKEALIAYKQSHQYQGSNPEDSQVFVKKLGIDTTGMTNEQVKSAIKESV
jgi:post-segregation antitoxin (ccd killing protein)